jgi:uncharacterized protein YlxW (UPF0749 family)
LPLAAIGIDASPPAAADADAGRAVAAAKVRLQDAINSQQERLEEVYSGALDGLSASDLASAVEEIETLFSRLGRVLGNALPSLVHALQQLTGSLGPRQPASSGLAATSSKMTGSVAMLSLSAVGAGHAGWIADRSLVRLPSMVAREYGRVEDTGSEYAFTSAPALYSSDGIVTEQCGGEAQFQWCQGTTESSAQTVLTDWASGYVPASQVGFGLSDLAFEADMSFSAAANNAVTAAVNVNSELNSIVAPLRSAVADVRRLADEIARLTAAISDEAANGRPAELAESSQQLKSALGAASATASGLGSGLPKLIGQLQDTVATLRELPKQANGSMKDPAGQQQLGSVIDKLGAAVSALRDAAALVDSKRPAIQTAEETIQKIELPGDGVTAAVQEQEEAVSPALTAIEKAVSRIQVAVPELEAAIDAAKDIELLSAPTVRD